MASPENTQHPVPASLGAVSSAAGSKDAIAVWPPAARALLATVCTNLRKSFQQSNAADNTEQTLKWRSLNAGAVRKRCAAGDYALLVQVTKVLEALGFELVEGGERWSLSAASVGRWEQNLADLGRCIMMFSDGESGEPGGRTGAVTQTAGGGGPGASSSKVPRSIAPSNAAAAPPPQDVPSRLQLFDNLILGSNGLNIPARIVVYPKGALQLVAASPIPGPGADTQTSFTQSQRSIENWATATGSKNPHCFDDSDNRVQLAVLNRLPGCTLRSSWISTRGKEAEEDSGHVSFWEPFGDMQESTMNRTGRSLYNYHTTARHLFLFRDGNRGTAEGSDVLFAFQLGLRPVESTGCVVVCVLPRNTRSNLDLRELEKECRTRVDQMVAAGDDRDAPEGRQGGRRPPVPSLHDRPRRGPWG